MSVSEDLSVGHHSHGGEGWVKAVFGSDEHLTCTVEYVEGTSGGRSFVEANIPLRRVTKVPIPFDSSTKRRRTTPTTFTPKIGSNNK